MEMGGSLALGAGQFKEEKDLSGGNLIQNVVHKPQTNLVQ